VELKVFVCA